jgi:two-component system, chemotaxis family, protein-glutamate methylesterase/glutaminase
MSSEIEVPSTIRVLVVDDSAFMRTALTRMIASEPNYKVVGTAGTGSDALSKIATLDPDVVTLDIDMPGMDGLEALRCIMNDSPRPVIMVSAATERHADATFNALGAGAFDYIPKQMSSASLDILHIRDDLIAKIRAAAHSRKSRSNSTRKKSHRASTRESGDAVTLPEIVAIGASTGGPRALQEILPVLPGDLPVPVLVVQHMPAGFTAPFAHRLNSLCSLAVREAVQNEPIQRGVVYIAPAGVHMTVHRSSDAEACITLDPNPAHLHTPSVDVMMTSVAQNFKNYAMGVILTGMGSDGAQGMNAIHREGGVTVGQDEASCAVYGMPRACAEMGALNRVVPLAQIPLLIMAATRSLRHA